MTKIFEASSDHEKGKMDPTLDIHPNNLLSLVKNGCQIRAVVEIAAGGGGGIYTYNCTYISTHPLLGGFNCSSAVNHPSDDILFDGFNLNFTYDENNEYNAVYFSEVGNYGFGYVDLSLYTI